MTALPLPPEPRRSKWHSAPTPRQLEILAFIRDYARAKGYPPTMGDIAEAHGMSRQCASADHLRALRRKGLLTMLADTSRTMRVTDEGLAALSVASLFFIIDRSKVTRDTTDAPPASAEVGIPLVDRSSVSTPFGATR